MKKTEVIRARVYPDFKEEFEKLAESKGMNVSEYMVYMIRRQLEREREKEEEQQKKNQGD
jgi:antitoxin component of RelBE/YafQ-DinJ toxin-antitoxin module